jgi:hypothetical protein
MIEREMSAQGRRSAWGEIPVCLYSTFAICCFDRVILSTLPFLSTFPSSYLSSLSLPPYSSTNQCSISYI